MRPAGLRLMLCVTRLLKELGRVDILVNSAGQIFRKPTINITEQEWNNLVDVNLTGTLRACQSFYEPLKASGRGRVVNIASLNSFVSFFEVTAYAASKSGRAWAYAQFWLSSGRSMGSTSTPSLPACSEQS